jgi:superfamily I DNA/RNA helicase
MNFLHVVGPPGTGKTFTLMQRIEELLAAGLGPDDICYCSFTKAAILEAKRRVEELFGFPDDQVPYFGTLHSLAFRRLGLRRDDVLSSKEWQSFCEERGLGYSEQKDAGPDDDPFEPVGDEEGDIYRRFYDWARNCLLPLDIAVNEFEPSSMNWDRGRALWFCREFEAYKKTLGRWDFPDMLIEAHASEWVPPVRVLILDEAQDLSPLQQRVWKRWAKQIPEVILGYDPDQAIYGFQGAQPDWLLNLPGERQHLEQSFRVPRLPALVAQRIIQRNQQRYPTTWKPRVDNGRVEFDADLEDLVNRASVDTERKWMFLARNRHYLCRVGMALEEAGCPYVNLRGPSPRVSTGAIAAFRLAEGGTITLDQFRLFSDKTAAKTWWNRGAKAELKRQAVEFPHRLVGLSDLAHYGAAENLLQVLSNVRTCVNPLDSSEGKKLFYLRAYQRGGLHQLERPSNVLLSTGHGVKGGEAEVVVLLPNMTRRTAEGYDTDPEPERRVWYVMASRTRNELHILTPEKGARYDDW